MPSRPLTEPLWFADRATYLAATAPERSRRIQDAMRLGAMDTLFAHCAVCRADTNLTVDAGLRLGPAVNLREGLVCPQCGLNQRHRMLMGAALQVAAASTYVLERLTPFYFKLADRLSGVVGSEYVDPALPSGTQVERHGIVFHHQDVSRLSFADATFDLVLHGDVFEHVFDYQAGLRELARVLAPGGTMLFTVPFREDRYDHLVRATRVGGEIRHLLPPEIHGNPIDPQGSLVYQTFGWRILSDLRAAGFASAAIGLHHDLGLGYSPNNSPHDDAMEAVLFKATR
ncbi:MAG: class I SAM-dependent methyltransferase [Pseudomonadota bacterium]|nr:class I SAM-dependent methyltransferase [Pseudomonadota bacterium]